MFIAVTQKMPRLCVYMAVYAKSFAFVAPWPDACPHCGYTCCCAKPEEDLMLLLTTTMHRKRAGANY